MVVLGIWLVLGSLALLAARSGPIRGLPGFGRDPELAHLGLALALVALAAVTHLVWINWRDQRAPVMTGLRLAAGALAIYLLLVPLYIEMKTPQADEPHWLLTIQSLALDQDLDLANDYAGERYRSFFPGAISDKHGIQMGEAIYPIREPGFALLAAPFFALAGRGGVLFLNSLVAAAIVLQVYLLMRDLRVAHRAALLVTALAAFTHPLLSYTSQAYPELLAALIFVTAARLLRSDSRMALVLAAVLIGLLPWMHTRAALIGLGLAAVVVIRAARSPQRRSALPTVVAAAALPVLALFALDQQMFGDWTPGAATRLFYFNAPAVTTPTGAPMIGGMGLLFDRIFGLVTNAPIYLLAFVGAGAALARRREQSPAVAALAAGTACYFGGLAYFAYWWADWSPPSRYMVDVLPAFAAAAAIGLDAALGHRLAARAIALPVAGLAVASGVITALFIALPSIRYNWAARDVATQWAPGSLWSFVEQRLGTDPGDLFPSLWWVDPSTADLAAIWLVVSGGFTLLGVLLTVPTPALQLGRLRATLAAMVARTRHRRHVLQVAHEDHRHP